MKSRFTPSTSIYRMEAYSSESVLSVVMCACLWILFSNFYTAGMHECNFNETHHNQSLPGPHDTMTFSRSFAQRSRSGSTFTFAICRSPSVCLPVVCNVRAPYSASEIFGNISTPLGTLAILWHLGKILRRLSQEHPFVGGVKRNRGSQI